MLSLFFFFFQTREIFCLIFFFNLGKNRNARSFRGQAFKPKRIESRLLFRSKLSKACLRLSLAPNPAILHLGYWDRTTEWFQQFLKRTAGVMEPNTHSRLVLHEVPGLYLFGHGMSPGATRFSNCC